MVAIPALFSQVLFIQDVLCREAFFGGCFATTWLSAKKMTKDRPPD
ncbi:MAG: hypothetical protein WCO53_14960 [Deltaproteobacteria bacterium]